MKTDSEEDGLTGVFEVAAARTAKIKARTAALLVLAPDGSVALVAVLYVLLNPWIPQRVSIHMGSDGAEHGSTPLAMATICAIDTAAFAAGGATARRFMKADHWYQSEKLISIGIESNGYGVVGVGLATIASTVGTDPHGVSGDSVAAGKIGFLSLFILSACVYATVLPRVKMEQLS